MIGLALGLAYAHPGIDDRLAAGAGSACDIDDLLSLARACSDEHRTAEAISAIERAAGCGAEPSVIALYRALGPDRGSLPALDAAVAAHPDHAGVRLARSRHLAALGRTPDAVDDARRALASVPRPQPDDVLYLARLQADTAPEASLDALDDGIARLGPAPALVSEAVNLELALGWPLAALGRLDGLPRTPAWLDLRATVLLRSGATAEASAVWAEALALAEARPTPAARRQAAVLRDLLATWR